MTPGRAPLNDLEVGLSRDKPCPFFTAAPLCRGKGWVHRVQDVLRWVFPPTRVPYLRDLCALLNDAVSTVPQLSASV